MVMSVARKSDGRSCSPNIWPPISLSLAAASASLIASICLAGIRSSIQDLLRERPRELLDRWVRDGRSARGRRRRPDVEADHMRVLFEQPCAAVADQQPRP